MVSSYLQSYSGIAVGTAPDLMPTVAAKKDKFVWGLKIMIAYDIELTVESETSTYGQVMIEP